MTTGFALSKTLPSVDMHRRFNDIKRLSIHGVIGV